MAKHRITQLRVKGMRALADITLDLDGLTVLVGENGSGKSTIIEALEMLRMATKAGSFIRDHVNRVYGSAAGPMRLGSSFFQVGVHSSVTRTSPAQSEHDIVAVDYSVKLSNPARGSVIDESLSLTRGDGLVGGVERSGVEVVYIDGTSNDPRKTVSINNGTLFIGAATTVGDRWQVALETMEIHAPFQTLPVWLQERPDQRSGLRWPGTIDKATSLTRFGHNLPSAFHALRNSDKWERVLLRARIALGANLRDIRQEITGRSMVDMLFLFSHLPDHPLTTADLSDGQLSYLVLLIRSLQRVGVERHEDPSKFFNERRDARLDCRSHWCRFPAAAMIGDLENPQMNADSLESSERNHVVIWA